MKFRQVYTSNYVNVERWPTTPETHLVTGAGVEDDTFKPGKNAMVIWIQLDGKDAKYRVNKTNAAKLEERVGDEVENLIGCVVSIQRVQMQIRGQNSWGGIVTFVQLRKGKKTSKTK
jgi:hypothetical protein